MKLYKILFLFVALAAVCVSCKEEEEDTTSKTLVGTLAPGSMPEYSNPGDVYTFEIGGLSLASDDTSDTEIIYTFKVNDKTDTVKTYTLTIPDTLGTYTITAAAYASGYYSKSSTISTIVVSSRSITGEERDLTVSTLNDTRNNKEYPISTIGGKQWIAKNLSYYQTNSDGDYTFGMPYAQCFATEDVFGGFYTWTEAQNACPSGWHLPTVEEWDSLGSLAGDIMCDAYYHGDRMWEFWPAVKVTNKNKFYAYPFGYATIVEDEYSFKGFGDYAFYWVNNGGAASCRYIVEAEPEIKVWAKPSDTDFAAQIRCVKD